ncbi:hypothetical protein Y032_0219g2464 [Ancylostoma ceylanicum]|uniref:Uncharacterized protein n=1 Tax=Ancylostoma ceylanicum TaxID=53326 RepID=A0A016SIN9_9BILA|nr:hypothetical protein Y032_0219g2464 [Ancylostoma ceylanicum]
MDDETAQQAIINDIQVKNWECTRDTGEEGMPSEPTTSVSAPRPHEFRVHNDASPPLKQSNSEFVSSLATDIHTLSRTAGAYVLDRGQKKTREERERALGRR